MKTMTSQPPIDPKPEVAKVGQATETAKMAAVTDAVAVPLAERPRRRWLMASLAGAATLAGAGLAVWREKQSEVDATADAALLTKPGQFLAADLWRLKFDTPMGQRLAMATFQGKPLLLNFWATWCPPCVEELPLIDAFYRENLLKGWQVVGIAADHAKAVGVFLGKMPLSFPVALAGMQGVELSKSLGNLSGGLPFTVIFGRDGTVRHRQMGRVTAEQLQAWRVLE